MATQMAPKHVGEPIVRLSLGSTLWIYSGVLIKAVSGCVPWFESKLGKQNGIGTVKTIDMGKADEDEDEDEEEKEERARGCDIIEE